jgi:hypothetical protein
VKAPIFILEQIPGGIMFIFAAEQSTRHKEVLPNKLQLHSKSKIRIKYNAKDCNNFGAPHLFIRKYNPQLDHKFSHAKI